MTMSAEGLPVINPAKCTGCGKCETVCPKQVIAMMPLTASVRINCNSKDKGAVARKVCTAACIACSLCMRQCPHGAITMESNLAVVNPEICRQVCTDASCLTKCPTKAIRPAVLGLVPGTESQASVEAVCVSCRQTGVAG